MAEDAAVDHVYVIGTKVLADELRAEAATRSRRGPVPRRAGVLPQPHLRHDLFDDDLFCRAKAGWKGHPGTAFPVKATKRGSPRMAERPYPCRFLREVVRALLDDQRGPVVVPFRHVPCHLDSTVGK